MGLWKEMAIWTLLIGPLLVTIYIVMMIPLEHWPIGDNYPENESLLIYFLGPVLVVLVPGVIFGSFLYLAKEVARS